MLTCLDRPQVMAQPSLNRPCCRFGKGRIIPPGVAGTNLVSQFQEVGDSNAERCLRTPRAIGAAFASLLNRNNECGCKGSLGKIGTRCRRRKVGLGALWMKNHNRPLAATWAVAESRRYPGSFTIHPRALLPPHAAAQIGASGARSSKRD